MAMLMQLAPVESIKISGGVIVREYQIAAGTQLLTHKHPYDHLSILFSGLAVLTRDDESIELCGPCMVEIKAGIAHGVYARTNCVWDCLHGLETAAASGDPYITDGLEEHS